VRSRNVVNLELRSRALSGTLDSGPSLLGLWSFSGEPCSTLVVWLVSISGVPRLAPRWTNKQEILGGHTAGAHPPQGPLNCLSRQAPKTGGSPRKVSTIQYPIRDMARWNEACHARTPPTSSRQGWWKAPRCRAALYCELSGSVFAPLFGAGRHAPSFARGWADPVALRRPHPRTTCWPG